MTVPGTTVPGRERVPVESEVTAVDDDYGSNSRFAIGQTSYSYYWYTVSSLHHSRSYRLLKRSIVITIIQGRFARSFTLNQISLSLSISSSSCLAEISVIVTVPKI